MFFATVCRIGYDPTKHATHAAKCILQTDFSSIAQSTGQRLHEYNNTCPHADNTCINAFIDNDIDATVQPMHAVMHCVLNMCTCTCNQSRSDACHSTTIQHPLHQPCNCHCTCMQVEFNMGATANRHQCTCRFTPVETQPRNNLHWLPAHNNQRPITNNRRPPPTRIQQCHAINNNKSITCAACNQIKRTC